MTTLPAAMRPVQAYTSHDNSPIPSPHKVARRVLGELTPNAKLAPKHLHTGANSPVKTTPLHSPLKAQEALPVSATLPMKTLYGFTPTSGSKKRSFSAIESPERPDATGPSMKRQQEMRLETVSPAALRSPLRPPVTVIDLQDDDTSTDEDESFDTSNGTDLDHIELPTNTQDANGSFSSLIDYNPDNASDRSDPATISPPSVRSTTIPVTSRVELLKLRLKMAMYKISTNQTFTPFAKLEPPHARMVDEVEADSEEQEVEAVAAVSPGQSNYTHAALLEQLRDANAAPENIIITGGPIAKLFEGPVLVPTTYSTRFIEAPELLMSPLRRPIETGISQQMTLAVSPSRGSSQDEPDLTSSVVKGHAASGLLELAHSR